MKNAAENDGFPEGSVHKTKVPTVSHDFVVANGHCRRIHVPLMVCFSRVVHRKNEMSICMVR